jgi:hypothetical protein
VFYGVSRNTCAAVYEKLLRAGQPSTRHGSGTFVAPRRRAAPTLRRAAGQPVYRLNPMWLSREVAAALSFWREPAACDATSEPVVADFRPGLVDQRHFP